MSFTVTRVWGVQNPKHFCGRHLLYVCSDPQIYLFDRVKSRDFGQAWSVFLLCQSLPAALGVPAASILDGLFAGDSGVARAGSLLGGALVLATFAVVFLSNCLREESSSGSRPR